MRHKSNTTTEPKVSVLPLTSSMILQVVDGGDDNSESLEQLQQK